MSDKTDKKNAKLGFFVLIGLILFLVAVFFIGSGRDMFSSTFELHAFFKDVSGLQKGNNIWLSGVKIGTVRRVDIANDSMVAVTLRIRENDRRFINEDATASIGTDGLIGNTIVVIQPGQMRNPIDEGDTIRSVTQTGAQDIMNTLETTGQNVLAITEDIQRLTRQINSGEGTLGMLIKSPELANNLQDVVQNLEQTSQRSSRITTDIAQMVNRLENNKEGPVHTLLNDTTFATVYDSLLTNIRVTGQNVTEVSRELEILSQKLNKEGNAVDVLLADTTFANDLQRTLDNAATGTQKFNESVEALQGHWLFGGLFREKKKKKD